MYDRIRYISLPYYCIIYFKLMTASTSIIICLTQFETILFFFFKTPPQRYKDTRLIIYIQQNRTRMIPPSWLNMMHMSHIIPSFISSILLLHIIRI